MIALSEALELCGYTKPLAHQFREEFTSRHAEEGKLRRIRRAGEGAGLGGGKVLEHLSGEWVGILAA
ncbi:MAG TPA: hypothetical protein VMT52_03745 [Planctomycetota bacterium]|nr:hypothetical protein [Planctomycetota bacterium]